MKSLQPVPIYSMGADEEKGETARLSSFVGAVAIGDLVKSTLGPKGMDKMLCSSGPGSQDSVQITNDGATIMKAIGVDNPAAKVLVDISRVQDSEVGDGTTSVVVLTSELLKQAENLIARKLHPQTIISGWRQGLEAAKLALSEAARECTEDNIRNDLQKIAETTISSKIISQHKLHFANLAVDAMQRVWNKEDPTSSLELISIVKKLGRTMLDSYLDEGFLLEKKIGVNQPKRMEDCQILIANTQMDTDKVKIFGTRVRVDSTAKVAQLELAEKQKMKEKVDLILKHNINVFVNRQLIYNYPEQLFADNGVMAIEHADFEGVERLARALDGEIVSTFHNPDKVKLGHCDVIEEVIIGEDKFIHFSGVAGGRACTVVIRGATQQILDEAERSLHDALCVLQQTLKEPKIIYGGGSGEMLMARAVQELADKVPGKESIAIEALATALRQLPTIIADNGGYDSADLIARLRALHSEGKTSMGLDMNLGVVADMEELGVVESYRVKVQMFVSAVEAGEMLLRVDNILRAAPRPRSEDNRPC